MYSTTAKLGFGAAVAATLAWLLFTFCFVAIAATRPPALWTTFATFLIRTQIYDQTLTYIAQACMVLIGPLWVVIVACLLESAPPERQTLVRIGLLLGLAFAVLTGINYWTHITAIRFNLERGTTAGLEQFLQHKPDSVMASINMLGWTIYFGLSSLFASAAFGASKLARAIRVALIVNAAFCLLAGLGFIADSLALIFLTINLGMGGAVMVAVVLLCAFFRRHMRKSEVALMG